MYSLTKSIDIDFAHIVEGHLGACINIHGHTWKFELTVGSETLDKMGFVMDFKQMKTLVLEPIHTLLDHSTAYSRKLYEEIEPQLVEIGKVIKNTRDTQRGEISPGMAGGLGGAYNYFPGGIKVAAFPFSPTSERLAEWFFRVAQFRLHDGPWYSGTGVSFTVLPIKVLRTRVYETLHPVESYAEYSE